ncbi:MAG: lasso RiPP family leader peptide-containing protein [Actinomycetota bacterium]
MNIPIDEEGPAGADDVAPRRSYKRPVLTDLGSVGELTLGAGSGIADAPPTYGANS